MGLQDRQIDHKIALQNIAVEIEHHARAQIHFFKRALVNVDTFYAISFLQRRISKAVKRMRRSELVFGFGQHDALSDDNLIDAPFL